MTYLMNYVLNIHGDMVKHIQQKIYYLIYYREFRKYSTRRKVFEINLQCMIR